MSAFKNVFERVFKTGAQDTGTATTSTPSDGLTYLRSGGGYAVFLTKRPPGYHVVKISKWLSGHTHEKLTKREAFHAAAERFDTLEQARLYFEAVRP